MIGETIEYWPSERHEVDNHKNVCHPSSLFLLVASIRLAVFGLCVSCSSSPSQMHGSPNGDAGVDEGEYIPQTCESFSEESLYETPQVLSEAAKNREFVDITEHALSLNPDEVAQSAVNATSFAIGPVGREEEGRSHIVMGDAYIAKPCGDSGKYIIKPFDHVSPPTRQSAMQTHVGASRLVDITGDGFPDLITARYMNRIRIYPGLGNGEFSESREIPLRQENYMAETASLTIFDVNGDGRLDILLSRIPTMQVPTRDYPAYEHTSFLLANRGDNEFEDISTDPEFEHIVRETRSVLYLLLMIPTIDPKTNILWFGIDMGDNIMFKCEDMTLRYCEKAAVAPESVAVMGSYVEYDGGIMRLYLSQTAYIAVYEIDPLGKNLLTNIIGLDNMEKTARGNFWDSTGFGDKLLITEGVNSPDGPPFPGDTHEPSLSVLRIVNNKDGTRSVRSYPDAVGELSDGSMGRVDWYGMHKINLGIHGQGAIASALPAFWTPELPTSARILAPTEPAGGGIMVASLAPPGTFFTFTVVDPDGKEQISHNWIPTSSGMAGQDDPAILLPGADRVIEMKARCPDGREEVIDESTFRKTMKKDTGIARAFFPDLCAGR